MSQDYKFKPKLTEDTDNKKLVIERLPEWMQNNEQIQVYFNEIIQKWFNPEEGVLLDGYIGDHGSPAAADKIFTPSLSTERAEYDLSSVYVSRNNDLSVRSLQFYDDLVSYMNLYGAKTDNVSRLFGGRYYSWNPPININKMTNFGRYYWDTENMYGITEPEYYVMGRGAANGNVWSIQNFWYTYGQKLPDGTTFSDEQLVGGRFIQARVPIIEYDKDIELLNYGDRYVGDVDLCANIVKPEDIINRRISDNIRIDGEILRNGDRILFTSLGNAGENNRIYKLYIKITESGERVYGLALDETKQSVATPTGEPLEGDVVLILRGGEYTNKTLYWKNNKWIPTQAKNPDLANKPLFVLYDRKANRLDDNAVYPNSTFTGSHLFNCKINYNFTKEQNYDEYVELGKYGYHVYENSLGKEIYTYTKSDTTVEIGGMYYFKIKSVDEEGNVIEEYKTDWVRSEKDTKQAVRQIIKPTFKSMFKVFGSLYEMSVYDKPVVDMFSFVVENNQYYRYTNEETVQRWKPYSGDVYQYDIYEVEYELAQKVDVDGGETIDVRMNDDVLHLDKDFYYKRDFKNRVTHIIFDKKIKLNENSIVIVKIYSEYELNKDLGAYEIPVNMRNNPYNDGVTDINKSIYTEHFRDIISKNITSGGIDDFNNYEELLENGLIDKTVGTQIIQNEAGLLPLLIHTANEDLDIFKSIMFVQEEYFRFKNRFSTELIRYFNEHQDASNTNVELIVDDILNRINIGKNEDFPFYHSRMGKTTSIEHTFIPPTPQFLGILQVYKPEKCSGMTINGTVGLYNIDHMGCISKTFEELNGNGHMDDVMFALEMRIYRSVEDDFKRPDYTPLLSFEELKPTAYYNETEYNKDEFDDIENIGFVNYIAANNIDLGLRKYNQQDWMTWNYRGMHYIVDGVESNFPVRGSWRGIFQDMYGTYRPHTHPWEMFGFANKPDWFNLEYEPTILRVGSGENDFITVYEPSIINEQGETVANGLWDYEDTKGDVSFGRILRGEHKGDHACYRRFSTAPFEIQKTGETTADGEEIHMIVLKSPIELGMISGNLPHISEPWVVGDMGEIEFLYKTTPLYQFDRVMALLRAKPAKFANYFYDTVLNKLSSFNKTGYQFLYNNGRRRLDLDQSTRVHAESGKRVTGYQQWVSDYLLYQNKNITKRYGEIVRSSGINIGHKLGAFTQRDNLTFMSDSFGLISEQNQYIGLVKNPSVKMLTLSAIKIKKSDTGYIVTGYDLTNPVFTCKKPRTNGRKTTVSVGKIRVNHSNEYTNENYTVKYNTLFKTTNELYQFICDYGVYQEEQGWIYEDTDVDGNTINWKMIALGAASWTTGDIKTTESIVVTPSPSRTKLRTEFGSVQHVAQYVGGLWTLLDENYKGIRSDEIETARIGDVYQIRMKENNDKTLALLRVNVISYEHAIIFDDKTIFGDIIYNPLYGTIHEIIKMYGKVTGNWNGRLEANGFMVLENDTLPNFEKIVSDMRKYYDPEAFLDNTNMLDLSNHLIGFQTRDYLRNLILDQTSQIDFYRGYIKEKGTHSALEKVLRTSKRYNTTNYKALEEWALKLGEFGDIDNIKHQQFMIYEEKLKQDPQLFLFDESSNQTKPLNSIYYYGKNGEDENWTFRSSRDIEFPVVKTDILGLDINLPDIGSVSLNSVDFVAHTIETLNNRRMFWQTEHENKTPQTAWLFKNNSNVWDLYNIRKTGIYIEKITPVKGSELSDGVYCDVKLTSEHNLEADQIYYFNPETKFCPEALKSEIMFVEFADPDDEDNLKTIRLPLQYSSEIVFGENNKVELVVYESIFNDEYTRDDYINEIKQFENVNVGLFENACIYNNNTNEIDFYMNIYDPIGGIFPDVIKRELSYISTVNPAIFNNADVSKTDVWGKEHVGKLWWDTSNTYYLDYKLPVVDAKGNVDVNATLEYRRYHWGRLLPYSSIDVYEWVRSPVKPDNWGHYCTKMSSANNNKESWQPSGEVTSGDYSTFVEYDSEIDDYREYYYFWVKDATTTPVLNDRSKSAFEISRFICDPLLLNIPLFAPISKNSFIIKGLNGKITDNSSSVSITYKKDDRDSVKHTQYQLIQEGREYNMSGVVWDTLWNSLTGEEEINISKINELYYPKNDLGCGSGKTWFMDVNEARRAFVDSANKLYKRNNIVSEQIIMDSIFNYKSTVKNPNEIMFKVVNIKNDFMISPADSSHFKENDAVLVFSDGSLPSPLDNTTVYYTHITDEGFITLMTTPAVIGKPITNIAISNKGIGSHTMIKQNEYEATLGMSLDMSKYWSYCDWYADGYNEFTQYVVEETLDVANTKNYQEGDIVKIFDTDGLWTLFRKSFSRNKMLWTAIAREKSTIELNDSLYIYTDRFDDTGNATDRERNIRSALRLLKNSFEYKQSSVVFDMIDYVHSEQGVVDWVFKTSYIYITGLEQSLKQNFTEQSSFIQHISKYYEEVKPYRTKIRSQIEQKTSDEDEINGICNDLDPNGYVYNEADGEWIKTENDIWDKEYVQFNPSTGKYEIHGSLPDDFETPNRMFQESRSVISFDNVACNPDDDLFPMYDLQKTDREQNTVIKDKIHYKLDQWSIGVPSLGSLSDEQKAIIKEDIKQLYDWFITDNDISLVVDIYQQAYDNLSNNTEYQQFVDSCYEIYCKHYNSLKPNVEVMKYVQYNTLANRLGLNGHENIPNLVGCPFKGLTITDNPNTRTGYGYNSYNNENCGFIDFDKKLYTHMVDVVNEQYNLDYDYKKIDYILAYEYGIYNIRRTEQYYDLVFMLSAVYNTYDTFSSDYISVMDNYIRGQVAKIGGIDTYISLPLKYIRLCLPSGEVIELGSNESLVFELVRRKLVTFKDEDPDEPVDPEDPDEPVDPEDPDEPVDPEDPDEPVDPEDPDEPDEEPPFIPESPINPDDITTMPVLRFIAEFVVTATENCMDDLVLDKESPLYSDYKVIFTGLSQLPYFDDMNAYDMNGFDGGNIQTTRRSNGEINDNDSVFVDISDLNPYKLALTGLRCTVSGYNTESNIEHITDNGSFKVEVDCCLNPYNHSEVILSIPSTNEVVDLMTRDSFFKRKYFAPRADVISFDNNKLVLESNADRFNIGDRVIITTAHGEDVEIQQINGDWRKVLSTDEIRTANRPTIYTVSEIVNNQLFCDGLNLGSFSLHDDGNLFTNQKSGIVVKKVNSFDSAEFISEYGNVLYVEERVYQINLFDYDLYFDRIITNYYGKKESDIIFDAWYTTNELGYDEDGNEIDHGFLLPEHSQGSLPELVRGSVRENIQIYVYEYNEKEIQPTYNNNKWEYNGVLVDDIYLQNDSRVSIAIGCDEYTGMRIYKPKNIKNVAIENGYVSDNMVSSLDYLLYKSGSIVQVSETGYVQDGSFYTAEINKLKYNNMCFIANDADMTEVTVGSTGTDGIIAEGFVITSPDIDSIIK